MSIDIWQAVLSDGRVIKEWVILRHNQYMWEPDLPLIDGDWGWAMKIRREMTDDNDFNAGDLDWQDNVSEMAKIGLTVFRAIIRDGGTWNEAFAVTSAFFAGSLKANATDSDD